MKLFHKLNKTISNIRVFGTRHEFNFQFFAYAFLSVLILSDTTGTWCAKHRKLLYGKKNDIFQCLPRYVDEEKRKTMILSQREFG